MSSPETPAPARSAKAQFDKQAAHYNTQWNSWSEENLHWLLSHANARPTDRVLDVATGTGFTALAFAPQVQSVVGLDVSSGMLAEAGRYAQEKGLSNVTFEEGAAEALPFGDATFDIVVCRIAAHHFLDVRKFVAEAARVLRPGGRFLLADTTVPDADAEAGRWQNGVEVLRDPSHVRNHTPSEWRQMVEGAGLAVTDVSDTGGGITIPLSDWMTKAGCTPDQADAVRQHFAAAPEGARRAFQITTDDAGDTAFTWRRVVLKAVKPAIG